MSGTDPFIAATEDGRQYDWPDLGWRLTASEIRRTGLGLYAELTVEVVRDDVIGHVYWERVNLSRGDDKQKTLKALGAYCQARGYPDIPWERMLEVVRSDVRAVQRAGAPSVRLDRVVDEPVRWLVDGIAPADEPTLLYGDGGAGKSTVAAALALVVATGRRLGPFRLVGPARPVLVCDWESTAQEWARRIGALCRAVGHGRPPTMHHRSEAAPLTDVAEGLRALVRREGIGLVVVDSLMAAVGGPITPETTSPFYNALRGLGVTVLLVHHLTKAEAGRESGPPRAYGDVTITNRARSAWALVRDEGADPEEMQVVMTHTKLNGGARRPSLGVSLVHQDAEGPEYAITVGQFDPLESGSTNLRAPDLLLAALRRGDASEAQLAEDTGLARTTLRRGLGSLVERGYALRLGGGKGRGDAAVYRIASNGAGKEMTTALYKEKESGHLPLGVSDPPGGINDRSGHLRNDHAVIFPLHENEAAR